MGKSLAGEAYKPGGGGGGGGGGSGGDPRAVAGFYAQAKLLVQRVFFCPRFLPFLRQASRTHGRATESGILIN